MSSPLRSKSEVPGELARRAASGVKWTGSSAMVNAGLAFLQTAVVAYYLAPDDFGLMSMAMVVVGFAHLFADLGLSSAIVHRRDPTQEELASLYWTNVTFGLVIFAVLQFGVPTLVQIFHEPRLTNPLRLVGLVFLILPFGQQHQFLMQKQLQFGTLATIISLGYLANAIVTIVLAIRGFGVYALILGHLANAITRTGLLVATQWKRWRPFLHFATKDLSGYLGFGLFQTGDRAANYFNVYLAHALIGSLLGARMLGYYTLAFELVFKPLEVITPVVTRVAFPIISIIREDRMRVRRGYLRMLRVLSAVNFPLVLGLAAVAPVAMTVFYGEKWQPAIIFVEVLALVALLRSTGSPIGALLLGAGKANWGFYWSAAKTVLQVPGLYLGIRWGGAVGAAVAFLVLQALFSSAAYLLLVRRLLGECIREYVGCFLPSLAIAVGVGAIVRLTAFVGADVPDPYLLILELGIGVAAYVALLFVFNRSLMFDLGRLIRERP